MNQKLQAINKSLRSENMQEFAAGDVVKIYRKIVEGGKERIQLFEGMIIAVKGNQSSSPMITVRKVSNGTGVELVLPIHSPIIDRIELVKKAKVRRAKLYFVRERSAKSLKMKYKDLATAAKAEAKSIEAVTEIAPETTEAK